jgi:hypothetical protein
MFSNYQQSRGPLSASSIEREASYIIAVRNPETPRPPDAGLDKERDAEFPNKLQEKFAGRKFASLDPPDFLDHEGAELIFIGAAEDPSREIGIEFKPDRETIETADVFKDLKLPREIAREPLFEAEWA